MYEKSRNCCPPHGAGQQLDVGSGGPGSPSSEKRTTPSAGVHGAENNVCCSKYAKRTTITVDEARLLGDTDADLIDLSGLHSLPAEQAAHLARFVGRLVVPVGVLTTGNAMALTCGGDLSIRLVPDPVEAWSSPPPPPSTLPRPHRGPSAEVFRILCHRCRKLDLEAFDLREINCADITHRLGDLHIRIYPDAGVFSRPLSEHNWLLRAATNMSEQEGLRLTIAGFEMDPDGSFHEEIMAACWRKLDHPSPGSPRASRECTKEQPMAAE